MHQVNGEEKRWKPRKRSADLMMGVEYATRFRVLRRGIPYSN